MPDDNSSLAPPPKQPVLASATFTSLWQDALSNHIPKLLQSNVGVLAAVLRIVDIHAVLWFCSVMAERNKSTTSTTHSPPPQLVF